jgi:hypothetical protein
VISAGGKIQIKHGGNFSVEITSRYPIRSNFYSQNFCIYGNLKVSFEIEIAQEIKTKGLCQKFVHHH